jgi:hypothetical protein
MNEESRTRTWSEVTQSVTMTAGWMIGWTALLILFGIGWLD